MRQIRQTLAPAPGGRTELREVGRALRSPRAPSGKFVLLARAAGVDWAMAQTPERRGTRGPAVPAGGAAREPPTRARLRARSTRSSSARASRCSCCGRSTPSAQRAGLQVHELLHQVPRVGGEPEALDAPDPRRRREAVRRLRRPDRADHRRGHRRDHAGADLRGRAGRVELHLRLRHRDADHRRLGRRASSRALEFIGGVPRLIVPDQTARADRAARPLRARAVNRLVEEFCDHYGVRRARRHARLIRATSRRSRARCSSSSAGSWRGCATAASSAWPSSTRAIAELLVELNQRPFKKLPGCRRERLRAAGPPGAAAAAGQRACRSCA